MVKLQLLEWWANSKEAHQPLKKIPDEMKDPGEPNELALWWEMFSYSRTFNLILGVHADLFLQLEVADKHSQFSTRHNEHNGHEEGEPKHVEY